jgi:hypothetical protein
LEKKMTEYQNWDNSRWEFTKQQSKWHFDTTRSAKLGTDSYTYVCKFKADFTDAINECMPRARPSSWSTRNNFNQDIAEQGLYTASAEEQDLIRAGADPKQEVFNRTAAEDIPLFRQIADSLGVADPMIKFHNQTTGQMLHLHMDNFAARPERENSFKVTEMDENPNIMRRFAIMLAPWKLGQVFQLGNANFTQWRAGDCITWEWQDMPHCTANMGWWDRPMLQITGRVTEKTQLLLDKAHNDIGKPATVFTL